MNSLFAITSLNAGGQQSNSWSNRARLLIDDTWPQAGEMRSLWKGTTDFWTCDMPQDDTWEPNRHRSHILPLFRSDLTRENSSYVPFISESGCLN